MATEAITAERLPEEEIQSTISSVKKMLVAGGAFAVVGYLLVGAALFFELTQFHVILEEFAVNNPAYSLAGGGAEPRPESVSLALAEVNQWPSTLLWLKLGGIAHVLVGIFIALAAIVRVLSMMPHRLSYEMERAQRITDSSSD
jgi:hypothetical protein